MLSYVWDAQGNPLAVYELLGGDTVVLNEFNLYGSSRLGMLTTADTLVCATCTTAVAPSVYLSPVGNKRYELSNHLGNVMTVISDKITPIDTTSDGLWDYFNPSLVSATDYYPFGMGMPGRGYSRLQYNFSFNGKPDETYWSDSHQNYGMRVYDKFIGRFISVDPKSKSFPFYSPFQFAGNKPTIAVDLDGLEDVITWDVTLSDGTKVVQTIMKEDAVYAARRLELACALDVPLTDLPESGSISIAGKQNGFGEKLINIETYYIATVNISPEISSFEQAQDAIKRLDRRYYGEKGFLNLGNDLSKGSTYVKLASPFVAITAGPNAGVLTYELGDFMENVGTFTDIVSDISNEDWDGLKNEMGGLGIQKVTNYGISKLSLEKPIEIGVKANLDILTENVAPE